MKRGLCVALVVALACRGDARGGGEAAIADGAEQALYRTAAPEACERGSVPTQTRAAGDTIVIANDEYPCRLYFRETGIVLRGDSAAGEPAPGEFVARDSRGRFFTSIADDFARIAVWNADGSFDRAIGQPGPSVRGLPRNAFAPVVYVDGDDHIYARFAGGLWSVFSPSLEYIGRIPVASSQWRHANAVFTGGSIVTSGGARGDQLDYFRVHVASGAAQGFGAIPLHVREGDSFRGIVAADDTSFWAGPDPADDDGYMLERWSTRGERLMGFARRARWFPRVGVAPDRPGATAPPRPTVNPMNVDGGGLLLVYALVTNDAWRPAAPADTQRPPIANNRNVHMELIDVRAGRVLASEVVNIAAYGKRTIPFEFFPGTNLGYRVEGRTVRIVEYGLAKR